MPVDIAELERRARRLLTPGAYDYYVRGAGRERTLRANVRAWRKYWLAAGGKRPRAHRRHPPGVAAELARRGGRASRWRRPGYADGGLRTAEDVLTALGLGARTVLLGRPVL